MTRARIFKPAQPSVDFPSKALPWLKDEAPQQRSAARFAAPRLPAFKLLAADDLLAAWRRTFAKAQPASPPAIIMAPSQNRRAQRDRVPMGLRKRIAVLLAIMTVPAMAAPGEFAMFAAPVPASMAPGPLELAAAKALSFERPGMSFPGSAFYFLDDPPGDRLIALPTADPLDPGAEAGRELGEFIRSGPAAKPFFSGGAGIAHARALECLAQAVWYEAASENEAGQRAVAQVVLNRMAHPSWPASVCGVVYQGSQRSTGCQFTFTCDGSLGRRAGGVSWARAQAVAADALSGKVYAPVGHATHYHTLWVNPYWASSLDHVGTIGAHRFYRTRGAGGEKAAFTMAYAGFEPGVEARANARTSMPSGAMGAPAPEFIVSAATERARKDGKSAAPRSTKPAASRTQGDNPAFTTAGEVRPKYANVGKWKADPLAHQAGNTAKNAAAAGAN